MSTSTIEPGLINKLVEMFKYRQILRDLKQDIEQHEVLSQGYIRTEGKHIVDTMLKFKSTHIQQVFAQRTKDLDFKFQRLANFARFENYVAT